MSRVDQDDEDELEIIARYQALGYVRDLMAAAGLHVAITDVSTMTAWLAEVDFGPAVEPTT